MRELWTHGPIIPLAMDRLAINTYIADRLLILLE